jgi:hypothetical protein
MASKDIKLHLWTNNKTLLKEQLHGFGLLQCLISLFMHDFGFAVLLVSTFC